MNSNERDIEHTTILMYEIGTGLAAAEILAVFDISEFKLSSDGRYMALASTSGAVSVWAVGDYLHQNISHVLEAMSMTRDFWHNFPIYLPDYHRVEPV